MKYDFLCVKSFDFADENKPQVIEVPKGYELFTITRWPVPGTAIEFWFKREHIKEKRKRGQK